MNDLNSTKKQLKELRKRQDANTAAREKVEQLHNSLASKTEITSQELNKLALVWATAPEADKTAFLECHERLTRQNALKDLVARADKGIAPILANKTLTREISRLSGKVDFANKRKEYLAILDRLHENYDVDLEEELIIAAGAACITSADLDKAALVYRKKHGMSVPSMYPLNLANQL